MVVGSNMIATQTRRSASLVVLIAVSPVAAHAEPGRAEGDPHGGGASDDVAPPPGEAKPLAPRPERAPTGRFVLGAGYRSDEGFIATAGVAQDNLFGTGHRLALDARLSARRQLFRIGYDIPHLLGTDLELRTELVNRRDQLPGFARSGVGGGVTLVAPLGPHVAAFAGYRVEEVTTTLDASPVARGGTAPPIRARDGRIAAVRGGLSYSTLDDALAPTQGMTLGVSLEVADPRWGSEIQLTRLDGWGSVHAPLGPLTLHLGGRVASVASRDAGGVPLAERLHLETAGLVRGFAPGALGPHDGALSLGGNFAYTTRAELELPLVRAAGISLVGFGDHGGIYDRSGAGSSGTSLGFGILWRSPIGPLRFDWAFPLGGDGTPQFVFGLGGGI